jgi:hypothetical protein
MSDSPVSNSSSDQKPTNPANPQQQSQTPPKPAEKPSEQQK